MASIGMIGYQPPHVANHQAGGIDPLALANIAGQLVAGQHPAGLGVDLHHNQVHDRIDHIDRERGFWIPAQDFTIVQGAPAITQYGAFPNCYVGWAFDPAADETVLAYTQVPYDWTGDQDIAYTAWVTRNVAGAGNVRWRINVLPTDAGVVLTAAGTDYFVTLPVPAVDTLYGFSLVIPTAIFSSLDVIRVCVSRVGTSGLDTFAADAVLLGVSIDYMSDE